MTHLAMWEAPAEGPESEWGALVTDAENRGEDRIGAGSRRTGWTPTA
jgi:hypothetical protein